MVQRLDSDSGRGRGRGRGPQTWKLGNDRHMEMALQTISPSDHFLILLKFVLAKFTQ